MMWAESVVFYPKKPSEIVFLYNVPRFPKEQPVMEGSQADAICFYSRTKVYMNGSMEHFGNDTDRGKAELFGENSVPVLPCPT
jgi:hypothetical protein